MNNKEMYMDLYNQLVSYISSEFIESKRLNKFNPLYLEDSRRSNSQIQIRFNKEKKITIIKNLEELKVLNCPYIIGDKPKDCDYILIDEDAKDIYYIELKHYKKKSNFNKEMEDIQLQLHSGKKWLEHLIFCSRVPEKYLSEFDEFFIGINKQNDLGQPKYHCDKTTIMDEKQFNFWTGSRFNLHQLRIGIGQIAV